VEESQEQDTPGRYVGRTPKNLPQIQDRRAEVVRLRAQGRTWDAIAAEVGYANGSAALKAWRRAIAQKPDLAVTEVRAAEAARLEEMDATLAGIIAAPPARTTAIGKTVTDPDTGATVRDMSVVVAAVRERRMLGESYRRLCGADAPASIGIALDDRQVRMMAETIVRQRDLDTQAPRVPLQLPPAYHQMTPQEQMRADLEARRTALQTQQAAIARADDPEIVDAEIVPDND